MKKKIGKDYVREEEVQGLGLILQGEWLKILVTLNNFHLFYLASPSKHLELKPLSHCLALNLIYLNTELLANSALMVSIRMPCV